MAIGTKGDFVIYHDQFFTGVTETLQQNSEAFNEASGGAIRLVTQAKLGDYEQQAFVEIISGLVGRRITTSTSSVDDKAMTMDEFVSVKLNRRIGPVAQTRDAFRKIARDPGLLSLLLGQQAGKAIMVDYVDTALNGLDAALSGVALLNADVSAGTLPNGPTMTHTVLVTGLSKRGDAANAVRAWVMHSKPFFDLMKQAIADKVFEVAGVTIMQGTIATFNRPTIIIDSPQLVVTGTPTKYVTLGLVEGAAAVIESEEREIVSETVTGLENLVTRVQGEYAFNLGIKGCKWNVSGGGANPDDATLASSSNWVVASHDNKLLPGVRILSQ
jgi:hypothetical protein